MIMDGNTTPFLKSGRINVLSIETSFSFILKDGTIAPIWDTIDVSWKEMERYIGCYKTARFSKGDQEKD